MAKSNPQARRLVITLSIILVLAIGGLAVIDIGSVAADRDDATAQSTAPAMSSADQAVGPLEVPTMAIVKTICALIVVLFAMYAGVYLLKRFMGRHGRGEGGVSTLEVLETTHLGPKKSVSLIRVGDRSVLVGVTDQQISVLSELSPEETSVLGASENAVPAREGFADIIRRASHRLTEMSRRGRSSVVGAASE